ncbi:hypothetical protein BCIN_15g03740 [Botrytis cinerea B05.10]|uniref:Tr-type G domain-containing protein n=1 Tax=Botryotinia fuckeliana (strain B05.10) TaxID=332648 RepID=A0A384K4T8_BOTFB|nr:hypothetical protein BCIN_15g03740 [Botrytis cinerea B05.10]ATZ57845.1 hypothetical protein BCIN_15g03740 [Botrytis cinerea B05.10]
MASIFTYEPEPPRVESPWLLTPADSPKPASPQPYPKSLNSSPGSTHISDYGVTKLEAEPQEGPTEYKLHLLLRPRRTYSTSSTGSIISGSQQHKQQPLNQEKASPILAPSNQSKQKRLEQLTTQLLWRLQQSSPYHASSTSDLVLPKLPGSATSLDAPSRPGKLLAGLEESRGALYEIGVSDDGTFVGLTSDELDESLTNLRAMAASLGCNVEIVRKVVVGECEWQETDEPATSQISQRLKKQKPWLVPEDQAISTNLRHREKLWVAEALITPDLSSKRAQSMSYDEAPVIRQQTPQPTINEVIEASALQREDTTEQLRITLTGPTTSGKSSLLGTLSTTTLDNGRGKSRLSLLKHRHEIATGITSSVAQELIGYKNSQVINYASGNVTSWTDIHATAEDGRLLFVSDSAGHPRYRRTTVRGLVGWAPHWTVLCVAADDTGSSGAGSTSTTELLGTVGAGTDLAKAHLELCLKLDKPLAIVITKLDLASRPRLSETLSKLLSAIKATGRTPSILPPDNSKNIIDADLISILPQDTDTVKKVINTMAMSDLRSIVPIILTSAVKGTGIRQLHALLQALPIPTPPTPNDYIGMALNPEQPSSLFHIEDVFGVPASYDALACNSNSISAGTVVAGHLRFGRLSIGDSIVVGPFPAGSDNGDSPKTGPRSSPTSPGTSLTYPSATELSRIALRNTPSASITKGEWHNAHIVSIRNLRLPVHTIEAGQVGTVGIVLDLPTQEDSNSPMESSSQTAPRIRKGMVMAIPSKHMIQTHHSLQAASGFTASFDDGDINSVTPGTVVVIYIASVRASARVLKLTPNLPARDMGAEDAEDVFGLGLLDGCDVADSNGKLKDEPFIFGTDGITDVSFELLTCREWIELGSQVLVMPGGGHGLYSGSERGEKGVAGLEGFVGRVGEVVD